MQTMMTRMRASTLAGDKTASPDWPQSSRAPHWTGTRSVTLLNLPPALTLEDLCNIDVSQLQGFYLVLLLKECVVCTGDGAKGRVGSERQGKGNVF